jgi:hypothetical protein
MKKPLFTIHPMTVRTQSSFTRLMWFVALLLSLNAFLLYKGFVSVPSERICVAELGGVNDVSLRTDLSSVARDRSIQSVASKVSTRFNIEQAEAENIIKTVYAHSEKTFPKREDILAIIAVESAFQTTAANQGAYGLMQVQQGWHKSLAENPKLLQNALHGIAAGTFILKDYYKMLGDKEAAIISYQVGPGAYLKGEYSHEYLEKVNSYRRWFGSII